MNAHPNPPRHHLTVRRRSGALVSCRIVFAAETRGDPLASFPALTLEGRPYNLWLSEHILLPAIARWCDLPPERAASAVPAEAGRESARARDAFGKMPRSGWDDDEEAILAATGVTANLQRSLAMLGEFALRGPAPWRPDPSFELSRLWCGIVRYPANAPYFPARVHPPAAPTAPGRARRQARSLADALWCSPPDIRYRCEEALAVLRAEVVRRGLRDAPPLRK